VSPVASEKEETASWKQILIVGLGNPLLGDEGVGPYVIRQLSGLPMPKEVEILDCGCDLLNLVSYIDKPKKVIIFDAIRAGGKPGQLHKFNFDELETIQTKTRSAHQLRAVDALRLLRKVCPCLSRCEIIVIGIEPKAMGLGGDLSQEVTESAAGLIRLVQEECGGWMLDARRASSIWHRVSSCQVSHGDGGPNWRSVDAYLDKAVIPEALLAAVERLLSKNM
jgi:hydrogenase maturation protease